MAIDLIIKCPSHPRLDIHEYLELDLLDFDDDCACKFIWNLVRNYEDLEYGDINVTDIEGTEFGPIIEFPEL